MNIIKSSTRKSFYLYFVRKSGRRVSAAALGPLSADPSGESNVFGHDGNPLGVDGAKIGVLEQTDQVSLGRFLYKTYKESVNSKPRRQVKPYFKHLPIHHYTCRAPIAADWNRKSVLKSWAISRTKRWNGSLRIRSSVDFWYLNCDGGKVFWKHVYQRRN